MMAMIDDMDGVELSEDVQRHSQDERIAPENHRLVEQQQRTSNTVVEMRETREMFNLQQTIVHGNTEPPNVDDLPVEEFQNGSPPVDVKWVLEQIKGMLGSHPIAIEDQLSWPEELTWLQAHMTHITVELKNLENVNKNLGHELITESAERNGSWVQIQKLKDDANNLTTEKEQYKSECFTALRKAADQESKLIRSQEEFARREKQWEDRDGKQNTEIARMAGRLKTEEERYNNLLSTMVGMKNADGFKVDDAELQSQTKDLRFLIKSWVENVVLIVPRSNRSRFTGLGDPDSKWSFFGEVTPFFEDYMYHFDDHKFLLEAYLWREIYRLIFVEDLWAGLRRSKPRGETNRDIKLSTDYHYMRTDLEIDETSPKDYPVEYHQWRSISARIIVGKLSKEWQKWTVEELREDLIKPLIPLAKSVEDLEIIDLDQIIEAAMELARIMAQQRAYLKFSFIPATEYGKFPFDPKTMTELHAKRINPQKEARVVVLTLAPRLTKYGTSEGQHYDTYTDILRAEVETKTVKR